eukprot:3946493-Prymnesium_polylepis.1
MVVTAAAVRAAARAVEKAVAEKAAAEKAAVLVELARAAVARVAASAEVTAWAVMASWPRADRNRRNACSTWYSTRSSARHQGCGSSCSRDRCRGS